MLEFAPQTRARWVLKWLRERRKDDPIFRLLNEQGYVKFAECRLMSDLSLVQPSDVLVWYTSDGAAAARRPREDGSS